MPALDQDQLFVCECPEDARSACSRANFYKERDGKRYCVLHYPDVDKARDFEQAMLTKYHSSDYDFRGVYFPSHVSFIKGEFTEDANFRNAVFNGQVLLSENTFHKKADFSGASFTSYTTFKGARFLGEAEFGRSTFSDTTYFENAEFSGEASFMETTFASRAYFGEAVFNDKTHFLWTKFTTASYFNRVQFLDLTQFTGSQFGGDVSFAGTTFRSNVYLNGLEFKEQAILLGAKFGAIANFSGSVFTSDVNFSKAVFNENALGSFVNSVFQDRLRFADTTFESRACLNFSLATFEKPERVSFSRVRLHPYWFLFVDSRKFSFTKVEWCNAGSYRDIKRELGELKARGADDPHHFLAITCRQLATNAEENGRYREAADLRFLSMELQRRESWHTVKAHPWQWTSWKKLGLLHWLYGFASGYGERPGQAAIVLLSILLVFAFVFYLAQREGQWWKANTPLPSPSHADQRLAPEPIRLGFGDSVIYSAYVMALQKPDPVPSNKRAKTLVFVEMLLGPLQAALLILAIRRKFMR